MFASTDHLPAPSHLRMRTGGGRQVFRIATCSALTAACMTTVYLAMVASPSSAAPANYQSRSLGRTVSVTKDWDRDLRRIVVRTDCAEASTAEALVTLEKQDSRLSVEREGRMSPALRNILNTVDDDSLLEVVVTPRYLPEEFVDRATMTYAQLQRHVDSTAQNPYRRQYIVSADALAAKHNLRRETQAISGVERIAAVDGFRLYGHKSAIKQLSLDEDVALVEELPCPFEPATTSHYGLVQSAFNPSMTNQGTSSIHCATFEGGVSTDLLYCIGVTPTDNIDQCANPDPNGRCPQHGEAVFTLMHWASPQSTPMHRKGYYDQASNRQWIQTAVVNTISQSGCTTCDFVGNSNCREILAWAFRSPYPTFCSPTDNEGWEVEPIWPALNQLSVGNVRHYFPTGEYVLDDLAKGCTQTRNREPFEDGYTSPRDWEMPSIVAPGCRPTSEALYDYCIGLTEGCGTSYSVAIVNGICASVMSANPARTKFYPEVVRAAILVSARDVDGSLWSSGVDGLDGMGVICGHDAESFVSESVQLAGPHSTAYEEAYDWGTLYEYDYPWSQTYKVRVPDQIPNGRHLRIVLTWDACSNAEKWWLPTLTDLDMCVFGDVPFLTSSSYFSNIEVLDIPAMYLSPGEELQVRIDHAINRLANSREKQTYYCIAWSWPKTSAN